MRRHIFNNIKDLGMSVELVKIIADSYPVVQGFVPENVIPGIVIQIYCKYNTTMIYYPI